MRIVVAMVLVGAFECGAAPARPGVATPSDTAPTTPTDPVARVLSSQPASVCEGWTPTPEPDVMEARQVVARGGHACARISSGRVRCWGGNENAELGACEDVAKTAVPALFAGVDAARDVSTGRYATCVVDEGGTLWCSAQVRSWLGADGPGRIDGVDRALMVAVGDAHVCAVVEGDRVLCFGRWDAAEALGPRAEVRDDGSDTGRGAGFVDLAQPRQIVAGANHSCVLEGQGRVMCWGQNTFGQLGDPTVGEELGANRGVPRRVVGLPYIESIRADQDTTCAVSDVGELFCWGQGFGPKALGVSMPPASSVAMGPGFVCVSTTNGGVSCGGEALGFAKAGQAGALAGYESIDQVAVGEGFVCGHRRDGMVLCQGDNAVGQLGGQHVGESSVLSPSKVLLGGVAL